MNHIFFNPIQFACTIFIAFYAPCLFSAPLNLSQVPPGNGGREPAPNVIITVDNSDSMTAAVNGGRVTADNPSKLTVLRRTLLDQFINNPSLVPDDRIRLAWQAMWVAEGGIAGSSSLKPGATNSMRSFSGEHRTNFASFINSLTDTSYGTISHQMMLNAYSYMKTTPGIDSPWADSPGVSQTTDYLACRRTYHIFMTDGLWTRFGPKQQALFPGNADGSTWDLPKPHSSLGLSDPPQYNPTSDQVSVYKDAVGGTGTGQPSTLADLTFRSWAEDLQPTMANKIRPQIKRTGSETFGSVQLNEFWNPKNDPATWQHITQHTIGFGKEATDWSGSPVWGTDTYSGDFSKLVQSKVTWPDVLPDAVYNLRSVELWHAALNGRGKFYPANTNASLATAFTDILDNIISDTSKPLVSIAASASSLRSNLFAYIAAYDAKDWSGNLTARAINETTGAIASAESWNAARLLDASSFSVSERFVLTYSGTAGLQFKTWSSLPDKIKSSLNTSSTGVKDDGKGQNRVDYIRGVRGKEESSGGIFRTRGSRLGDIVNSNILYVGKPASGFGDASYNIFRSSKSPGVGNRQPMVYVGANDGMLHGFNATDGIEKLAYIPQGIAESSLRKLTDTTYSHQYYVDGHPFSGDAKLGPTPTWKTLLVGSLAGGGKGYFILDITDPDLFKVSNTEVANLVITDTTATSDPDIGNMYTTPVVDDFIPTKSRQIVKLNSDNTAKYRWAVVLGNGYNSANEAPVLIVQYLDGGKEIHKISPCVSPISSNACSYKGGNGLSTPQLIDLNGDGVIDVAYAGDLSGNLWKFDLSSQNKGGWKTSFEGKPFFIAKPNQSFTTAPYWMAHPNGGVMLSISSGKNLTTADQITKHTETVYSLYDNSKFTTATPVSITDTTPINTSKSATLPTDLVPQTINTTTFTDNGITYYTNSSNPVSYTGSSAKRGWYLDWSLEGQRVLQNSKAFDGEKFLIKSTIPNATAGETCTPSTTGERSFTTVLNMFTGHPSKQQVFDISAPLVTKHPGAATMENNPAGDTVELRTPTGIKINPPCPVGQTCTPKTLRFANYIGVRANWREVR